jgi:hypothetical protein
VIGTAVSYPRTVSLKSTRGSTLRRIYYAGAPLPKYGLSYGFLSLTLTFPGSAVLLPT